MSVGVIPLYSFWNADEMTLIIKTANMQCGMRDALKNFRVEMKKVINDKLPISFLIRKKSSNKSVECVANVLSMKVINNVGLILMLSTAGMTAAGKTATLALNYLETLRSGEYALQFRYFKRSLNHNRRMQLFVTPASMTNIVLKKSKKPGMATLEFTAKASNRELTYDKKNMQLGSVSAKKYYVEITRYIFQDYFSEITRLQSTVIGGGVVWQAEVKLSKKKWCRLPSVAYYEEEI
jgi:hypothetical protein